MIETLLFWIFAVCSCGGAIAVVMTQNVVRMAFWLVVSLGSIAGLFFLLHADFVAASQLLIYVGGTVVLLVFGVMLTASGPYSQIRSTPAEIILSSAVGAMLLFVMASSIGQVNWTELANQSQDTSGQQVNSAQVPAQAASETPPSDKSTPTSRRRITEQQGRSVRALGLAFVGLRTDRDLKPGATANGLSPNYFLPFEIISIHLLVVLIGAAYLARAKRRVINREEQDFD